MKVRWAILLVLGVGLVSAFTACEKPQKKMYDRWTPERIDSYTAGPGKLYGKRSADKILGEQAPAYKAYTFEELYVRPYLKDTVQVFRVEIAKFRQSKDAFGICSYLKSPRPYYVGQGGYLREDEVGFWKGHYFVRVRIFQPDSARQIVAHRLVKEIAHRIPKKAKGPDLVELLPEEFQLSPEVRYFRSFDLLSRYFHLLDRDVLHMNGKVEAAFSVYRRPPYEIQFLLVRYPTVKERAKAERDLRPVLFPENPKASEKRDPQIGWIVLSHEGRYLTIVAGNVNRMILRQYTDLSRILIREYEAERAGAKK